MDIATHYIYNAQLLAQAYDCGTYGAEAYGGTSCETATAPATSTGPLAYTGDSFWATLIVAGLLVLIPAAYFVRKIASRRKK